MTYLYYTVIESSTQYKALLVLDNDGRLCYASLGKLPHALREELVKDFRQIKEYKLKSLSTTTPNKKMEETIQRFKIAFEDPRTLSSEEIPIRIIFGTSLQRKVWDKLLQIPPGSTIQYKELAESLGLPNSSRAIGNCCGANKISLIIPCHRALGKMGKITGYRWGTDIKEYLLKQELGDKYREIVH
ncbi:Methylated-DNA--protein-cysteine methyltransferase [Spathaspora sp. JA1]|nr:Methylated-DNA--protein-cysteine methyltransferase [Spathaspora sp. JA1]